MPSLTFERCQPLIGAEVAGIDLTHPIPAPTAAALRKALVDYQVLVFRNQNISREQHRALGLVWACDDVPEPFHIQNAQANPIPEYPEIFNLQADGVHKAAADVWHTDESYRRCPPTASILRCRVCPTLGGDTVFSSGIVAYERLPDDVKKTIRNLKALHGPIYQETRGNANPEKIKELIAANLPIAQPVVRIHPDSGKPVLYVNVNYTGPIVGMENAQGEKLRRYLFDQFLKPDYMMRVRWRPHTIVIWDNRSVQHYAVYDYNEPRHMERILVAGNKPAVGFA
jgi:alpha-ketoglutarate-dependent taurine dioxygenase